MNQKLQQQLYPPPNQVQVWTALVTPFLADQSIDYDSLARLVDIQNSAGNGILLFGSTGEGLALSEAEKREVLSFVCQQHLKVPLMVAVGGFNLAEQLQWLSFCNQLPIDAYLLATPLYAKPGPKGQLFWFEQLLTHAQRQCMLYNVPSRSGVAIDVTTLAVLQEHDNCWALKEASGDITTTLNYIRHCPKLVVFSGEDALVAPLAATGIKGLVSVCANAWPEATKKYVSSALSCGQAPLFLIWSNAIAPLFSVANPIAIKSLMCELGLIKHNVLRPPLIATELTSVQELLTQHDNIMRWQQQAVN